MTSPEARADRPAYQWVEHSPLPNTLRLPATAESLLVLGDVSEETLSAAGVADWLVDPATRVVGGGSNLVFVTARIDRAVRIAADRWTTAEADDGSIDVVVEAGMGLDVLVRETTRRGWFGLEALAEIPGTVGAAPMQNVGAYGREIADITRWVEAWDRQRRRLVVFPRDECAFGYRDSRFKHEAGRWLILRVGLRLSRHAPAGWPPLDYPGLDQAVRAWSERSHRDPTEISPADYADVITAVRLAKLPDWRGGLPGSAGSFFHNPVVSEREAERLARRWPSMPRFAVSDGVKIPAGWLIEASGLKGYRQGTMAVSPRHALVLEHHGGASGEEFLRFAESVRQRVAAETGIELRVEPECISER